MPIIFIQLLALAKYLEPRLLNFLPHFPNLTHADQCNMHSFTSDANPQMDL